MVIVQIAKKYTLPSVIDAAEETIKYFEEDFPESSTLITASCFPDDITPLGLSGFKVWHGVLIPYDPDHILTPQTINCIEALVSDNNLHAAINQSIATLKKAQASKWEKCFMLRFLLHSVGDIHQPFHCIQLYSNKYPTGDLAGHRYSFNSPLYRNMHILWDSAFGVGSEKMNRPLSSVDESKIYSLANFIADRYPPELFADINDLNFARWSKDSYEIAISSGYECVDPEQEISIDYLEFGREIALRQMALAGYRLATILNDIFVK